VDRVTPTWEKKREKPELNNKQTPEEKKTNM
jgi:hypothetical protein